MNVENEFLRAYDKYSKAVLRHIYFRVSDWETAQDINQETFFKSKKGRQIYQYLTDLKQCQYLLLLRL